MNYLYAAIAAFNLTITFALADSETCQNRIILMQGMGLLKSVSIDADGVALVVNERLWGKMSFSDKQSIASTFTCATLPNGESYKSINFKSDLTNKKIGSFVYGRLAVD